MNQRRALLGLACAAALTMSGPDETSAGRILHEVWEKTYQVSENLTLRVQNIDGRIYIYGSEANELKVTALKRTFTRERMDAISIEVSVQRDPVAGGETAIVNTIIPAVRRGGITQDRSGTVDYTILVPQTCSVSKADLRNGEILVEGLRGTALRASAGSGRVLARNCFTQAQLSVGRGGMDVFYDWWEEQPFSLAAEVSDGDLCLALPPKASVRLNVETSTGQITNRTGKGEEQSDGRNLRTIIGDGAAEMNLRTGSGNIRIEREE